MFGATLAGVVTVGVYNPLQTIIATIPWFDSPFQYFGSRVTFTALTRSFKVNVIVSGPPTLNQQCTVTILSVPVGTV